MRFTKKGFPGASRKNDRPGPFVQPSRGKIVAAIVPKAVPRSALRRSLLAATNLFNLSIS